MSSDSASDRIQRSILAQATGEETFEQGLLMRWVDRMAQQEEYKHLDQQFFIVARALVLYDFQPKKFLDICVRQGGNVKFMDTIKPESRPEMDGTFSKTVTFNGVDYVVKHFRGVDKVHVYREVAIQNALYLMMPRHVPFIRGWNAEYIFMNKVNGLTLDTHLGSNKLTKAQLEAIIDIFTHLAFLGITHSDAQGRNLLIRSDTAQVVVIDFNSSDESHGDLLSVFGSFASQAELSGEETDQLKAIVGGSKSDNSAADVLLVLNRIRTVLQGTADSHLAEDTASIPTDGAASAVAANAVDNSTADTPSAGVTVAAEADLISMFGAMK